MKKKILIGLLSIALLMTSCGDNSKSVSTESKTPAATSSVSTKTLQVAPDIFQQRFNEYAHGAGFGELAMEGDLTVANVEGRELLQYFYNNAGLWVNLEMDKSTNQIKKFEVIAGSREDIEILKENLLAAITIYPIAIEALDPNLSIPEIEKILKDADYQNLDGGVGELAKDTSTNYKGITYTRHVIKGFGIVFSIAPQ